MGLKNVDRTNFTFRSKKALNHSKVNKVAGSGSDGPEAKFFFEDSTLEIAVLVIAAAASAEVDVETRFRFTSVTPTNEEQIECDTVHCRLDFG
jgi:hypothetical protein